MAAMGQDEVEQEMTTLGRARYRTKLTRAREKNLETTLPVGRRLLAHYLEPYADEIAAWKRKAKKKPGRRHRAIEYLDLLPDRTIAALAARAILDGVAQAKLFTRAAMTVASRLEDEARFNAVRDSDPGLWRELYQRTKNWNSYGTKRRHIMSAMQEVEHGFSIWPQKDKCNVGVVLVELFANVTGLVEIVNRTTIFGKTRTELHATANCHKMLMESHDRDEMLAPCYLPCVIEPKRWTSVTSGGFHSVDLHKRILIKTWDRQYLDELAETDLTHFFKAINGIQSTPFRINEPVLEVFKHFWVNSIETAGLPSREDLTLPTKPDNIGEDEEVRKKYRRAAAAVREANAASRSERIMLSKVLWIAEKYTGKPLWFTSQCDFRGRQYPVSLGLHPQGPSVCRGLLLFDRGKPIEDDVARSWLAIGIANAFGHDKKSLDERVAWIEENQGMLLRIASNPYDNKEWQDAGCPWTALAGAFEWAGYIADPENFISRMPIPQDATQSGLQILSLLTRNTSGAIATNCIDSEEPQDLYGAVAAKTCELLAEEGSEMAKWWLDFGIDRTTTKRQTMVSVYGGTPHAMFEYTRSWYQAKSAKTGKKFPLWNTWQPCMLLSTKIREAMASLLSGPMASMDWFQEVGRICCQHNLPIRWTTPIGLPVKQFYTKWRSQVVKTRIGEKIRTHSLRVATDTLDHRKSTNALTPNFIHSLDSSAMFVTVNTAMDVGIKDFAMVHDSFGTLASDSAMLAGALRASYAEMFSLDLLKEFSEEVQAYLPEGVELPPLPEYGDLDPNCVRNSTYFFN